MKALYYDGTKAVYREDLPVPVYCEGHSLIKIIIANICNTDRECTSCFISRLMQKMQENIAR